MEPDRELEKIFVDKVYKKDLNRQIRNDVRSFINEKMNGKKKG